MTTPSNSIKNIVPNGNLTNDATGWSLSSVNRLEGGGFAFQPNSTAMAAVTQGIPKPKAGHLYYGRCVQKSPSGTTIADGRFEYYLTDVPGQLLVASFMVDTGNEWKPYSAILSTDSPQDGNWQIRNFTVNSNNECYRKECMFVDLTESYGKGNEPIKEELDLYFPFIEDEAIVILPPRNLTADIISGGKLTIQWQPSRSIVQGYNVYRDGEKISVIYSVEKLFEFPFSNESLDDKKIVLSETSDATEFRTDIASKKEYLFEISAFYGSVESARIPIRVYYESQLIFKDVTINPNPCKTNEEITVKVKIEEKIQSVIT